MLSGPDTFDGEVASPLASAAAWVDDLRPQPDQRLTPAAVLVGIVTGDNPGVLLTKRTEALRKHPGQVSFPGGRMDPADASPEEAALREAWEEIGLPRAHVEILGRLRDYATGTNYRVTPVVALITPGFEACLSEAEVEAVFELPLSVVLDPRAPELRETEWQGQRRQYWVWPHERFYIWGATAAILVHLAHRLRASDLAHA